MNRHLIHLMIANALLWYGMTVPVSEAASVPPILDGPALTWYEGHSRRQAVMALDEIIMLKQKGKRADALAWGRKFHPDAAVAEENEGMALIRLPQASKLNDLIEKMNQLRNEPGIQEAGPVCYPAGMKNPDTRMALTGELIVRYPESLSQHQIRSIEKQYGLIPIKILNIMPNTLLYIAGDPLNALETANRLHLSGKTVYAYPHWIRSRSKRSEPNDTLFPNQWHLKNTGQGQGLAGEDVNIFDQVMGSCVWDTWKGSSNEIIAVVDDGLEILHEDLKDNIVPGLSWDYVGGDEDPSPGSSSDTHGTCVAGVAAGRGFNGIGVIGSSPDAGLAGYRLLGVLSDASEADALTRRNDVVDIYSNSWGPADNAHLEGPGPLAEDALAHGAAWGRGGLGSIYVWAGGNGALYQDNANYDGYANSRYTIAVGASTNYGKKSSYSESGACILINSPSNGGSLGITTTDLTGAAGYSSGNYNTSFGGTSSACPLVSGIIALMLQANPQLSWRDVQHILIQTAEKNDPDDADWTSNSAGYPFNHKYGFGRIDASAAVSAAVSWENAGPETSYSYRSTPEKQIPDNNSQGISEVIYFPVALTVESVEVWFSAEDHSRWGDLEIVLTSPAGTRSVLAEKHTGVSGYSYDNWRFGSVRHFGEMSLGNWTLTVKDLAAGETGTFRSWNLKIYGTLTEPVPEPANHPADFKALPEGLNEIRLSWTDAVAGQVPHAYLIRASAAGYDDIIPPEDGPVLIPDDRDLSDGRGAINIQQGIQNCHLNQLLDSTVYYFKIFPYTVSTIINYKTDEEIPQTQAVLPSCIILLSEDLQNGKPDGWMLKDLAGSGENWRFDNPAHRAIPLPLMSPAAIFDSDYNGPGSREDATFESPVLNVSGYDLVYLNFDHYFKPGYGGAYAVEVFTGAKWEVVLSGTTALDNMSESLNITHLVSEALAPHIRFRWTGEYSWYWMVDNIKICGARTGTIPGDIDRNGVVTLNDALLLLNIMSGKDFSGIMNDMNSDGRIGLEEVIYILKNVSEK